MQDAMHYRLTHFHDHLPSDFLRNITKHELSYHLFKLIELKYKTETLTKQKTYLLESLYIRFFILPLEE